MKNQNNRKTVGNSVVFTTLYKKTSTGAIQQWTVSVQGNQITTEYGQVDGKIQGTVDIIKKGKNPGKKNATTAEEQALKEAESKWEKQKKKRYVETIEEAQAGEVDEEFVQGGIAPMLAPSKIWPTFAKKMKFPVYVQPKLDGTRMIAVLENGRCTLWSRTQKPMYSMPHIIDEIETRFGHLGNLILDGEAYNVDYWDRFEDLLSLIRQEEPAENHEDIHYHIYDLPSCEKNFSERNKELLKLLKEDSKFLKIVPTYVANCQADIDQFHENNVLANYEGSMVRNDGPYESGKRSYQLQKLKDWKEDEYKIVGAEEGRGKDAGTVGAFVLALPNSDKTFKCRLKAPYSRRKELLNNPSQWENKLLTVKYQTLTSDGIPRILVGKGIRDYE